MIMMKIKSTRTDAIMRMLIVIPLSAILIIAIASCSGSRKATKTKTEIAPPSPPPPPPPPPPPVQNKTIVKEEAPIEVFTIVEEMPQFPGGDAAINKFIIDNLKYPQAAKDKGIQGKVMVKFVVTANGNVDQVELLKGVEPSLDNEAIRVVKMLPPLQPGKQGGKVVNVWYVIPIAFVLSPSDQISSSSQRPSRYVVQGNDTIYTSLKEMPQFPGGQAAFTKFKSDNIKYPVDARKAGFGGTVSIAFIVEKDGSLTDLAISSGVCPSIDAEALRVAKLMPEWVPGKENGRAVKARSNIIFQFVVNPEAPPGVVFVIVEQMPQFPGGDSLVMKFIKDNIKYPKSAIDNKIVGRVTIKFCINYLGRIEQVGVVQGVDPALDAEAIRVIKSLPVWEPGKQAGNPVNVWYILPVVFSLPGVEQPKPKPQIAPALPPPLITGYDVPPVFPGGEAALVKFIESVKKYPQEAKDKKISGTIMIRFTITETGSVDKVMIASSVDPALDLEATRVVGLMSGWQPGKLKGKPVSVTYTIPVSFKL
jgi:TonB family protein